MTAGAIRPATEAASGATAAALPTVPIPSSLAKYPIANAEPRLIIAPIAAKTTGNMITLFLPFFPAAAGNRKLKSSDLSVQFNQKCKISDKAVVGFWLIVYNSELPN